MFSADSVVLRFAAPLSCVALENVKLKCPSDLVQTLIFFAIVGGKSSLHSGWNHWGNGKGRWLHQNDLNCWINGIKANGQWCLCRLSEGMSPAIAWSAVHTKQSSVKLMKSASVSKKLRWVYSGEQQNVKTEKKLFAIELWWCQYYSKRKASTPGVLTPFCCWIAFSLCFVHSKDQRFSLLRPL